MVRKPDLRSTGRGFESRPPRCSAQPWASCLHTCASVTKQYNLVPANGRWRSAAGKVTAGLADSSGSLPPGLWLRSPADCLCRGPGSAPEPYARFDYGTRPCRITMRMQELLKGIFYRCRNNGSKTHEVFDELLDGIFSRVGWCFASVRFWRWSRSRSGSRNIFQRNFHHRGIGAGAQMLGWGSWPLKTCRRGQKYVLIPFPQKCNIRSFKTVVG